MSEISVNNQAFETVALCVRAVQMLSRRTLQNAAEKSIVFFNAETVTTKRRVRYNIFTDRRSKCAV